MFNIFRKKRTIVDFEKKNNQVKILKKYYLGLIYIIVKTI